MTARVHRVQEMDQMGLGKMPGNKKQEEILHMIAERELGSQKAESLSKLRPESAEEHEGLKKILLVQVDVQQKMILAKLQNNDFLRNDLSWSHELGLQKYGQISTSRKRSGEKGEKRETWRESKEKKNNRQKNSQSVDNSIESEKEEKKECETNVWHQTISVNKSQERRKSHQGR